MAFTVTFHSTSPAPSVEALSSWLVENGEPFEAEGPEVLVLRALPMRIVIAADGPMQAQLEATPSAPLQRLVDIVFDLSVLAGADVHLAGGGTQSRAELWLRLADEQDRRRLGLAVEQAEQQGRHEDVVRGLWAVVAATNPGKDLRWSAEHSAIVEMREIGGPEGIPLDEARWYDESRKEGDVVPVPVRGTAHILAWRWLSEAWPGLLEGADT